MNRHLNTCEWWLPSRRQCDVPADGLFHWRSARFLEGSHSFLSGFGPKPPTALCWRHKRLIEEIAGHADEAEFCWRCFDEMTENDAVAQVAIDGKLLRIHEHCLLEGEVQTS